MASFTWKSSAKVENAKITEKKEQLMKNTTPAMMTPAKAKKKVGAESPGTIKKQINREDANQTSTFDLSDISSALLSLEDKLSAAASKDLRRQSVVQQDASEKVGLLLSNCHLDRADVLSRRRRFVVWRNSHDANF